MPASLRRPRPLLVGGVLAWVLVVGGCTGEPDLTPDEQAACRVLTESLPTAITDGAYDVHEDREVTWGDPEITLRCGAAAPGDYDDISACTQSAGVGWYVPPDQVDDQGADVTLYAMSHVPVVEIDIPAAERPEGPATVMADLGPAIVATLEEINPCR